PTSTTIPLPPSSTLFPYTTLFRSAVFYPTGGTSEIQRLQMATQEGANVAVYAVRGNFDDAQTGVKRVFADKDIAARLAGRNIRLDRKSTRLNSSHVSNSYAVLCLK